MKGLPENGWQSRSLATARQMARLTGYLRRACRAYSEHVGLCRQVTPLATRGLLSVCRYTLMRKSRTIANSVTRPNAGEAAPESWEGIGKRSLWVQNRFDELPSLNAVGLGWHSNGYGAAAAVNLKLVQRRDRAACGLSLGHPDV